MSCYWDHGFDIDAQIGRNQTGVSVCLSEHGKTRHITLHIGVTLFIYSLLIYDDVS